MKILITGGAGFIGSHLANYLFSQKHDVYVIDDLSGGYRENLNPKIKFIKLDLRERKNTAYCISKIKPEVIYHLAADATEGRSQFTPIECTTRNINAFLNTIVPAIKNRLKKFVFTSSMAVYGAQKPPFSENMEPKPEDVYGTSKYAIEQMIKILAKVHKFDWTILRPHNVYGPNQNMADPYRNVVAIFMNCMLKNKQFYVYGDGKQKRAFSYIGDITPCIAKAGFDKKTNSEIINIGSPKEHTINQLAGIILEVSNKKDLKPVYLSKRPQEVKEAFCTNKKAESLLNYKDKINLSEGIKIMWKWAKQKGPQQQKYLDNIELPENSMPETWKKKLI